MPSSPQIGVNGMGAMLRAVMGSERNPEDTITMAMDVADVALVNLGLGLVSSLFPELWPFVSDYMKRMHELGHHQGFFEEEPPTPPDFGSMN